MTAIKLSTICVEKPWGRHSLGAGFPDVPHDKPAIGEIWFEGSSAKPDPLLVKYLFTSERLSIQVHPNDAQAQEAGFPHGKEECWIILAAGADARIGLGTQRVLSGAELRAAALDGSLEELMDWKPVQAGDVIYVPAGTVHAIGAGVTLVEVQQNVDLTYRLYDYGRPRELHLDAGIAASKAEPFHISDCARQICDGRTILTEGGKFVVERWEWTGSRTISLPYGAHGMLVPVSGSGAIDAKRLTAGECWRLAGDCDVVIDEGALVLFATFGPMPLDLAT